MSVRVLWGLIFLVLTGNAFAQSKEELQLENLRTEQSNEAIARKQRVDAYCSKNNVLASFRDSEGNLVLMVDVSESGIPIYKTTDNAGAAITTGVVKLREGGGLGLDLQGEGMTVAVWDGGVVDNHIEFGDRILSREGSDEDQHATHVTGTILATGLNASAKGMAPKAKAMTFDFNNDEAEMLSLARPDQTGTVLSNHSYGLITGWRFDAGSWQWFGDAGVSNQEDYKFGYYSGNARLWDQIAFNAPYYLMVKSAGNDRSDTGPTNRTFPSDCNGGSGFDCLSDISNAKNILVIGAVNKVPSYTNESSVVMSSFSSWGPTDDGRIKPDLVAAGVNIFSTVSSTTNNQYGTLSGTSMATPNTTGSLVLLQELYKSLHGGNLMKSATLRALSIHTAKEAGLNPGPDYSYGWGLLDVEAGAKVILAEDGSNTFIEENRLTQGQPYEKIITPKPNQKITVTIAWTDPAGTVVSPSLDPTNIMLVNDLDVAIVNDANEKQLPWILNPSNVTEAASTGNNIRDNIEKIEFANPQPRSYKVVVNHKGNLQGGAQDFSIIITYTSLNDPRTVYYWIGNGGSWSTASNWSLSSGGTTANSVPGPQDRVIVDENSFSAANQVIQVGNQTCGSLTWLAKNGTGMSLNNGILTIDGNLTISAPSFVVSTAGTIRLTGGNAPENTVTLSGSNLSNATLLIDGESSFEIVDGGSIGRLEIDKGDVDASSISLSVGDLNISSPDDKSLDLAGSTLTGIKASELRTSGLTSLQTSNTTIETANTGSTVIDWSDIDFNGELKLKSLTNTLFGTSDYNKVTLTGNLFVNADNTFGTFSAAAGNIITLNPDVTLSLSENTTLSSTVANKISFITDGGTSNLLFEGHYKLCFDNLIIDHVDAPGSAVINAGTGSVLTAADNWVTDLCENVLFPDFDFLYNCIGSLTEFTDKTSGNITSWSWSFGDPASGSNTSELQSPNHIFSAPGTYTVTLEVSNENDTRSFIREITLLANNLPANEIVISSNGLFSFKAATAYQWYRNNEAIPDATLRTYDYNGEPGAYFVVTKEGQCNIPSSITLITGTAERDWSSMVKMYPNPAKEKLYVTVPEGFINSTLEFSDPLGKVYTTLKINSVDTEINLPGLNPGLYFAILKKEEKFLVRKIIVGK